MTEEFDLFVIVAETEKEVKATDQLSDVKVKGTVPEGTFTKGPYAMVKDLLKASKGDIGKAIKKLTFYKNRAGENLTNKKNINKALKILQNKNELEK